VALVDSLRMHTNTNMLLVDLLLPLYAKHVLLVSSLHKAPVDNYNMNQLEVAYFTRLYS